jgi:hypothetical protein
MKTRDRFSLFRAPFDRALPEDEAGYYRMSRMPKNETADFLLTHRAHSPIVIPQKGDFLFILTLYKFFPTGIVRLPEKVAFSKQIIDAGDSEVKYF